MVPEKELKKCLEELDGLKGSPSEKVVFKELKKDIPTEKAKVDLESLPGLRRWCRRDHR